MLVSDIAKYIDHTLLKPEATKEQIDKLCLEAKEYGFASVCVNPAFVPQAKELLQGTAVKVCTVIGFPLGATLTEVKAFEAQKAIDAGAQEIDMVINIGALKSGNYDYLAKDIKTVAEACNGKALLKVIIETCLLTKDEIIKATEIVLASGADFVKTSTSFAGAGATRENVKLMRDIAGERIGVKAAGGVRSYSDAIAFLEAGATRLGTSAGVAIVTGLQDHKASY